MCGTNSLDTTWETKTNLPSWFRDENKKWFENDYINIDDDKRKRGAELKNINTNKRLKK